MAVYTSPSTMRRSGTWLTLSLILVYASGISAFANCNGFVKEGTLGKPLLSSVCRFRNRGFLSSVRLSEVIDEEGTTPKKESGSFFFLRNPLDREKDRRDGRPTFTRVPKETEEVSCACGSKRTYSNCCKKFHDSGEAPDDPVNLIRARYSAFAYRLPGYIMRTTAQGSSEWKINQNQWEKEILGFCDG